MEFNNTLSQNEKRFLEKGYIIQKIDKTDDLRKISKKLFEYSKEILGSNINDSDDLFFFNEFHNSLATKDLNNFRVTLINKINSSDEIKKLLYNITKCLLNELVGNELAVQKRLNLSIQFPKDDSSLLPIHADTWSGDSPFEIVTWLPLVDCYKTKSMYLLPPKYAKDINKNFKNFSEKNADDLFNSISDKVEWIDIKYGEVLIFNQSLPHGNIVNNEKETRWSINCRFKGLFTPYGDKKLGEFFEPLNIKIMSKIGMNYKYPEII